MAAGSISELPRGQFEVHKIGQEQDKTITGCFPLPTPHGPHPAPESQGRGWYRRSPAPCSSAGLPAASDKRTVVSWQLGACPSGCPPEDSLAFFTLDSFTNQERYLIISTPAIAGVLTLRSIDSFQFHFGVKRYD